MRRLRGPTPHYALSRYPGGGAVAYTRERAERCLLHSRRITSWVREEYFRELVCGHEGVLEVYPVGSRARGDHRASSDFVVVDADDVVGIAEEISRLRRPVPVDVIVVRREDLEDPIYRPMLEHGKGPAELGSLAESLLSRRANMPRRTKEGERHLSPPA